MVKITNIDSLKPYLFFSRYIGMGRTALCFLMRDNRLVKVYLDTYNTYKLFSVKRDMVHYLENLGECGNDSYIVPDEILVKNGEVVAFIMRYIPDKTIAKIKGDVSLNKLEEAIKKLEEDTFLVSEKYYRVNDLHDKNMLFKDNFTVIDTDGGIIRTTDYDREDIFENNMENLICQIIETIFKVPFKYDIAFFDKEIKDLYNSVTFRHYKSYKELFEYFRFISGSSNPSIKVLRSKKSDMFGLTKKPEKYFKGF